MLYVLYYLMPYIGLLNRDVLFCDILAGRSSVLLLAVLSTVDPFFSVFSSVVAYTHLISHPQLDVHPDIRLERAYRTIIGSVPSRTHDTSIWPQAPPSWPHVQCGVQVDKCRTSLPKSSSLLTNR